MRRADPKMRLSKQEHDRAIAYLQDRTAAIRKQLIAAGKPLQHFEFMDRVNAGDPEAIAQFEAALAAPEGLELDAPQRAARVKRRKSRKKGS